MRNKSRLERDFIHLELIGLWKVTGVWSLLLNVMHTHTYIYQLLKKGIFNFYSCSL